MLFCYRRVSDVMRGKLIVIEGTDCSGKETQASLLVKKLNEMGIKSKNYLFLIMKRQQEKLLVLVI